MVHRRLSEGLLRVHGSVEDLYKTRGTFEWRQKLKGSKVSTVMRVAIKTAPIPMTVGTFQTR